MTFAPYWLMPTPWPLPVTVKVNVPPPYAMENAAERREKSARTCAPVSISEPTGMLDTRPLSSSTGVPNHVPGSSPSTQSG